MLNNQDLANLLARLNNLIMDSQVPGSHIQEAAFLMATCEKLHAELTKKEESDAQDSNQTV